MKHALLFFLVIASIPLTLMGQPLAPHMEWLRTLSDEAWLSASDVRATDDGGLILTGVYTELDTVHGDRLNVYLAKLDADGRTTWVQTYGHAVCYEQPQSVVETEDHGYLVAGLTSCDTAGTGNWGDLILLRTDEHGDSLWMRQFDMSLDDMAWALERTPDGGYIVGGWEMLADVPNPMHMLLMKFDSNGDSLWTRRFRAGARASGWAVKPLSDGGYVLAGVDAATVNSAENIYVVKTDGHGDTQWERTYGLDTLLEPVFDVAETPDGDIAVTGWVYASAQREDDAFILRLNAEGDSLWMRLYGNDTLCGDHMYSIDVRPDGGFVLGGQAVFFGSRLDSIHPDPAHPPFQAFELIGVSASGEQEWVVRADSAAIVEGRGMCRMGDGSYVMAATTMEDDVNGHQTIHLMKFGFAQSAGQGGGAAVPLAARLQQNYPNPFNPVTEIAFDLPRTAAVKLVIFDVLGREVARPVDGVLGAGHHSVTYTAPEHSTGIYYYRLETEAVMETRAMLLMK